ncbi:MAG: helix-turn-helix transcriptional regulator [Clostridia bacterium]|nr:helix-turn-helix transcriptional regulator [Clostridia bacterium]
MKQLSLGKKIKNLRLQKGMTQADLAGETITRNMLSQIENEAAQPSVNTIFELSEKLETPTEYFFSEISDPAPFHKIRSIEKIRKTYASGDYGKCIYRLDKLGVSDDETEFLYARSCFGKAQTFYREGRLTASEEFFGKALVHAGKTVYINEEFFGVIYRYLKAIRSIRKREDVSFCSEETERNKNFISDILYLDLLEGKMQDFDLRELAPPYEKHLSVHRGISESLSEETAKDFMCRLKEILKDLDDGQYAILKYYILCDMEVLAQKTGDYKCAYECSSARLMLSEKMNT